MKSKALLFVRNMKDYVVRYELQITSKALLFVRNMKDYVVRDELHITYVL
jgi:hypothetical protein